jgi:hypothetical protein
MLIFWTVGWIIEFAIKPDGDSLMHGLVGPTLYTAVVWSLYLTTPYDQSTSKSYWHVMAALSIVLLFIFIAMRMCILYA